MHLRQKTSFAFFPLSVTIKPSFNQEGQNTNFAGKVE